RKEIAGVVVCVGAAPGSSIIGDSVVAQRKRPRAASFIALIRRRGGPRIADKIDHFRRIKRRASVISGTISRKQRRVHYERYFAGSRAGQIDRSGGICRWQRRASSPAGSFFHQEIMTG